MKIDLFLLGLATIPFDNLPFAPSAGWAAISPLIFFAYSFFNLRLLVKVVTKHYFLPLVYMSGGMAYQFILLMLYGMNFASFFDGVRGFVLGLIFYFSLIIRYETCHADINRDARVLYKAYLVSFIYGVIWLIVYKISPSSIALFKVLEKRHYHRLAYTFTEPSFTGMHTIGVMFMFTYFLRDAKLVAKFIRLSIAFMALSILSRSSARCAADFIVVILLIFVRNVFPPSPNKRTYEIFGIKRKSLWRRIIVNTSIILVVVTVLALSARVYTVMRRGTNADPSAASRWFRINASLKGYMNSSVTATLAGWGMGNMIIPFKAGAGDAFQDFHNSYTGEVNGLQKQEEADTLFCLPIRLVSEWGLALTAVAFFCILLKCRNKKIDIYVLILMCWLYVQFDSYIYYTFWLVLYLVNYYDPDRHGVSFFEIIS